MTPLRETDLLPAFGDLPLDSVLSAFLAASSRRPAADRIPPPEGIRLFDLQARSRGVDR